jgi:hypothetical protein
VQSGGLFVNMSLVPPTTVTFWLCCGGNETILLLSEVDSSCLSGCLVLFLLVENGVNGALGKSKLRCGSFSINFLLQQEVVLNLN